MSDERPQPSSTKQGVEPADSGIENQGYKDEDLELDDLDAEHVVGGTIQDTAPHLRV
jgi:hypothetical protein